MAPFRKEMPRILKFTNLESGIFEFFEFYNFLCTSDRFLFIGGYICFTKLFSVSKKFEDSLRQARYII